MMYNLGVRKVVVVLGRFLSLVCVFLYMVGFFVFVYFIELDNLERKMGWGVVGSLLG